MNAQQSREAFEEWVTSRRGWLAVERLENGSYAWLPTAEAWVTWQAAVACTEQRGPTDDETWRRTVETVKGWRSPKV